MLRTPYSGQILMQLAFARQIKKKTFVKYQENPSNGAAELFLADGRSDDPTRRS